MKELWTLFWTFAKMGVMTFGGGMAMLPILQREVVENKHWATEEEMTDYYAIGQCTPGIIAVNTATFIGQKYKGIAGGIVATLGLVFPSLVIISILAGLINNFADLAWVQNAFAGVRVAVSALIVMSVWQLARKNVKSPLQIALAVVAFALVAVLGASPVYVVIGCVLLGLILDRAGVKA